MASMWHYDKKSGLCKDLGDIDGGYSQSDESVSNAKAAASHDAAHGKPGEWVPLPRAWVPERLMPTKPLTDAEIAKYERKGYRFDAHSGGILTRTEAAKKEASGRR